MPTSNEIKKSHAYWLSKPIWQIWKPYEMRTSDDEATLAVFKWINTFKTSAYVATQNYKWVINKLSHANSHLVIYDFEENHSIAKFNLAGSQGNGVLTLETGVKYFWKNQHSFTQNKKWVDYHGEPLMRYHYESSNWQSIGKVQLYSYIPDLEMEYALLIVVGWFNMVVRK